MPRPIIDVNSTEYQAILHGRAMYRRYGADYKDMMWADDVLTRLEGKLARSDYTPQDRADFLKAREIHARAFGIPSTKSGETAESHTTTHYIWRTRGDDKVRLEHRANDGLVFSWENPPPTGHPGEDYGCRCWAEPYTAESGETQEHSTQTVTFAMPDFSPAWLGVDFAERYFYGDGKSITLFQIGHLQTIINAAKVLDQPDLGGKTLFQRVSSDVRQKARQNGAGGFPYGFKNSYNFKGFVYSIGGATVSGRGQMNVEEKGDYLIISADVEYHFRDVFTDVFSIGDATRAIEEALGRHRKPSDNPGEIGEWDLPGSTPYLITDMWSTHIEATIKKDSSSSRFPDKISE